jgi:hypothetical protein
MSIQLEEKRVVCRRSLPLESLRALIDRSLLAHTQCEGVHIRRIFLTEPDATGCNWQIEWPFFRPATVDPCRSQLRALIGRLRARFNVEL